MPTGITPISRRRWILAIAGIPFLVLLVLMSGVFGWSDLNSVHDDVDIRTGRVRRTRYLFYVEISEQIENSVVSAALPPERLAGAQPEWRRVNTFCGWSRVSPHYRFTGALGDLKALALAQSAIPFTDEAKQRVADTVLQLWQSSGSCFAASEYIWKVADRAMGFSFAGRTALTVEDLPASDADDLSRE